MKNTKKTKGMIKNNKNQLDQKKNQKKVFKKMIKNKNQIKTLQKRVKLTLIY